MDLIQDDGPQSLREPEAVVEHRAQDLGGTDQTWRLRVQLSVPRQQTHGPEPRVQLAVFLIRESLHGGGVDHPA